MARAHKLGLYLDAARNVTPRQAVGRLRRAIPPVVLAAGIRARPPGAMRPVALGLGVAHAPQSGPTAPPHEDGVFRAVGVHRSVGSPRFWSDPEDGLLFLFHLHGFEPLARYVAGARTDRGDAFWESRISSWLDEHPRPTLPAWHPYPTSNRVIAWVAALSARDRWSPGLRARWAGEALRQARYLRRAIEHDIGGNHVIRNGVALAAAGAVFPASGLLAKGLRTLRREAGRQVLPDGGHQERSTSYHLEVQQDLVDVAALHMRLDRPIPDWLEDAIERMEAWSAELRGPDGRLPLLNDAWEGPRSNRRRARPLTDLRDSGYLVLRAGEDQLVFDVAPLSAPHLPPHAHADALSFVLWGDGLPVVIDPGTCAYTGPRRAEFRQTRAHNTVEVDAEDQCVFWGDFRLASPPRVHLHGVRRHGDVVVCSASHDGYRRLPDPVSHFRTMVWWPGRGVVAVDLLRAGNSHRVRSSLRFAPGLERNGAQLAGPFEATALGDVQAGGTTRPFSPYLGRAEPTAALELEALVAPDTPFGWSLLRPPARVSSLTSDLIVLSSGEDSLSVPLTWDR